MCRLAATSGLSIYKIHVSTRLFFTFLRCASRHQFLRLVVNWRILFVVAVMGLKLQILTFWSAAHQSASSFTRAWMTLTSFSRRPSSPRGRRCGARRRGAPRGRRELLSSHVLSSCLLKQCIEPRMGVLRGGMCERDKSNDGGSSRTRERDDERHVERLEPTASSPRRASMGPWALLLLSRVDCGSVRVSSARGEGVRAGASKPRMN